MQVSLDGEALSITGAGIEEITLRPGQYQFRAIKDGHPVKTELVSITRGGRQVMKVRLESLFNKLRRQKQCVTKTKMWSHRSLKSTV